MLRIATCLVALWVSATSAQAQPIPSAFHGTWANEDCRQRNSHINIAAQEMSSSVASCIIQPGTVRRRPSGISFQSRCTDIRQPGLYDGFTVLEFEAGYDRQTIIRTHFVSGVMSRKEIRPEALGLCIRDTRNAPYRFSGEEPPNHWRAYEPQRAARLISGEPAINVASVRRAGACNHEFCATHNEAERCFIDGNKLLCTVIYTEFSGTKLYRGSVNVTSGALESRRCIANCRHHQTRQMTLADIDSDTSGAEDESD